MELEHKKTFEALRKNPALTNREAAEMVVMEHLEEDKNYYLKDTIINPFKLLFGFNY
jgi:hypothetical protein